MVVRMSLEKTWSRTSFAPYPGLLFLLLLLYFH